MKLNLYIAAMAASCLAWSSVSLQALVVTDNNLTGTPVPDFSSNNNLAAYLLPLSGGPLYALQGSFASTTTGQDIAPYYLAGISGTSAPASASDLLSFVKWARTNGNPYPLTQSTMVFGASPASSSRYLVLGMGAFEGHKAANYSWAATGMTLYTSTGAQGNLVPNASFENANIGFWSDGGSFASNAGKQGSSVWQITGAKDSHIGLPVIEGQEYSFSFWSASPAIGSGHQIEYGFTVPADGFGIGLGNTAVTRYLGGGNIGWTEYTGTFVPAAGQTTWYLGGMANGGSLLFDSVYLAAVPEPGVSLLVALGGGLLAFKRYRRR